VARSRAENPAGRKSRRKHFHLTRPLRPLLPVSSLSPAPPPARPLHSSPSSTRLLSLYLWSTSGAESSCRAAGALKRPACTSTQVLSLLTRRRASPPGKLSSWQAPIDRSFLSPRRIMASLPLPLPSPARKAQSDWYRASLIGLIIYWPFLPWGRVGRGGKAASPLLEIRLERRKIPSTGLRVRVETGEIGLSVESSAGSVFHRTFHAY
jgi:hypothetical protein